MARGYFFMEFRPWSIFWWSRRSPELLGTKTSGKRIFRSVSSAPKKTASKNIVWARRNVDLKLATWTSKPKWETLSAVRCRVSAVWVPNPANSEWSSFSLPFLSIFVSMCNSVLGDGRNGPDSEVSEDVRLQDVSNQPTIIRKKIVSG